MILYLDTSSLIKLYLEELHSDLVRQWVSEAEVVTTSRVAYPEAMAALARRFREEDIDKAGFEQIRGALAVQWQQLAVIDMNEVVAGGLAVKHGLRGFDAIHLEAALATRAQTTGVVFSSFDERLNTAAVAEGCQVFSA